MSKFIVIEGLIGVGKTSLCRLLEREWNARLVLEPAEDNPFLASFYSDPKRFAFPAQMFYLASRYAQQMELAQPELFNELVISDYLYRKDRLFALQTLNEEEMELYDRFAGLLHGNMAKPEFVLFLDAPTSVVMTRIARRALESERVIEPSYLEALRNRYYALWDDYDAAPVYVVDTTSINYVDDDADAERMMRIIQGYLDGVPVKGSPEPYERKAIQLALF